MNTMLAALRKSARLRRADVALGEWIARAFPGSTVEVALAGALAARAIADGHSALELARASEWLAGLDGDGKPPALPHAEAWCEALSRSAAVHANGSAGNLRPLVLDGQGRVYLRRYFDYEQQLARALTARAQPLPGFRNPGTEPRAPDIDPDQQRAIDIARTHRFALVTGGPGTGKTHSVARMLSALAQAAHAQGERLRIALAAPTGKAAARLGESLRTQLADLDLPEPVASQLPRDAKTVHGVLGISPWRPQPRFDRAAPLPLDVVVVDEVSMVDLPLMAKLVVAIPESARLILLGDPDQLSAVEAGSVLGALVEAANAGAIGSCHVALTRSHRFGADSALGALAASITRGDAGTALRTLADADEVALVEDTGLARLIDSAAEAYRPIVDASDPGSALDAARGFRVLTALRHGASGCLALDRAIVQRLQRALGKRADETWWRGRLVLVTANRPELGLFNGDTGVVWPEADGSLKVWFETSDGAPRAFAPAVLPPHEGAFALTVHKAQGSEIGRVALVTGPDSAVLSRELLYTGVTRARHGVALYSTPETLQRGIANRTFRMSGLADRLREAAGT
jgi:exodeoxyribonuclease V alpha subunit